MNKRKREKLRVMKMVQYGYSPKEIKLRTPSARVHDYKSSRTASMFTN